MAIDHNHRASVFYTLDEGLLNAAELVKERWRRKVRVALAPLVSRFERLTQ
jgi:hypothetical protein